ncbi:unnamed protein product, partial [Durusdinium trenchii]
SELLQQWRRLLFHQRQHHHHGFGPGFRLSNSHPDLWEWLSTDHGRWKRSRW